MGVGEIVLLIVSLAATWASIAKRVLAVSSAAAGVLMLAYFATSITLGDAHPLLAAPYRIVNIYVFLFIAVLLALAGCIGLLVHFTRHLRLRQLAKNPRQLDRDTPRP